MFSVGDLVTIDCDWYTSEDVFVITRVLTLASIDAQMLNEPSYSLTHTVDGTIDAWYERYLIPANTEKEPNLVAIGLIS